MKKYLALLVVSILLFSCEDEMKEQGQVVLDLPTESYTYSAGDELGTLGRVLFYDKQLSVNNAISCASCHKQGLAFSDERQFSRGFNNRLTTRNSMPIQNLASSDVFFLDEAISSFRSFLPTSVTGLFWDGRGEDHTLSLLLPIVNHIEMGVDDLNELSQKLSEVDYYPQLFQNAFGSKEITPERLGVALQAFTHSISSGNTKFDQHMQEGNVLSGMEALGMQLFMEKYDCNTCHQVQDPQGYIFAGTFSNIGLEPEYADEGLELTTNQTFDNGKFKIPSLRNVALTAPYMHDGRFETLEEVVDHYKTGVTDHPNLDPRLKNEDGSIKRPKISRSETQTIIAFLNTMTDYEMISDERFSNPFKVQ